MKKTLVGLILGILAFSALPSIAEVWDSPHKYFDKRTNKWIVYIPTTNGGATKEREFEKVYDANDCGWVTFGIGGEQRPITSIKIGDDTERFNSHSNAPAKPKCTQQQDGSYKSDYNVPLGTLLKTSVSYHFLVSPNEPVNIKIKREVPIFRKGTQCGFILFGVSDKRRLSNFRVNGSTYNLDTLPIVKHPRICYKGDNEWVLYTPDNF